MGLLSSLGSALSSVLSTIVSLPVLEVLAVFQVLKAILEKLGIIEPEVKEDELGDKALQAEEAGIKRENFDTYDDFYKEIQNFEVDPNKSKKYSDAEKAIAATLTLAGLAEEKIGSLKTAFAAEVVSKFGANLGAERADSYSNSFKDNLATVTKYFKGELSDDQRSSIEKQVVDTEKKLTPEKSGNDILREIDNVKAAIQGLDK